MANELNELTNNNPVPLLRFFGKTNSKELKDQILYKEMGKRSFFVSLLNNCTTIEAQKDLLDLCMENGYSLEHKTKEDTHYWTSYKVNSVLVPDYLYLWNKVGDDFLSILTQKCSTEFILELETQYPILKKAYLNKRFKTIELLEAMGVGERRELYKPDEILKIAKEDADTLNFYWKQRSNPEQEYLSIKEFFLKELNKLVTSNGNTDNYTLETITKYIDKKFEPLPQESKEDLIAHAAACINLKPYNHAIKATGQTIKSYKGEIVPVWKYLNEAKNHQIFHKIVEDKVALDARHKETSYLHNLTVFLLENEYGIEKRGSRRNRGGNDYSKLESIYKKMDNVIDKDFWLTPNPQDNNHPWFHTACNSNEMLSIFSRNWLIMDINEVNFYNKKKKEYSLANFTPIENTDQLYVSNLDYENKEVLKDLLARTWLYKDETNKTCLETALELYSNILYKDEFREQFNQYLEYDVLPCNIKEILLYKLVKVHNAEKELIEDFAASLVKEPSMDWDKFSTYIKGLNEGEDKMTLLNKIVLDAKLPTKSEAIKRKI